METRSETILNLIIEEYIKTAEPVGSKALSDLLGCSSATVRNEMSALESEGFLAQPHTSSGRVPTEKAYVHYLRGLSNAKRPPATEANTMRSAMRSSSDERARLKTLGRALAELSGETIFMAHGTDWSSYIGIANLFAKPDFAELAALQSLSAVLDHLDEIIGTMFGHITEEPAVMIGHANPFDRQMSVILVRYPTAHAQQGLIGILGPMRMDYRRNLAVMETAQETLS